MNEQQYYTPPQLSKLARTTPDTILSFIASGELRAVNFGRGLRPRWRITKEWWDDFLASRQNQPKQEAPRSRKRQPATKDYFAETAQ